MIKNKNPTVSVIIACYNDADYIEQAVASVINQTYVVTELIIVDDGSDEKTRNVLKTIELKTLTLIFQKNQGVSAARNTGIDASLGDYIMIMDSDDFLEPAFIEKALSEFKKHKNIRIVSCYARLIYEKRSSGILKIKGGNLLSFLNNNCALGTSLYKKKDIKQIGGYDEEMFLGLEDWEFNIRIISLGGIAKVIQEPLYNYRIKPNSRNATAKKNRIQITKYIVNKNKDLYVSNIEHTLPKLFFRMEKLNKQNEKLYTSLEYKCGRLLIAPFRYFKNLVKK